MIGDVCHVLPRHLYVHVPFCARRCTYCDFSIAVRSTVPIDDYVRAIEAELALRVAPDESWVVDTLYFGGGTPSQLGGAGVRRLIDTIRSRVSLAPGAEVTLEAIPDDVTPASAACWSAAGINRLSIGAQSFDDGVLQWMHRTHDAAAIGDAVRRARAAGFENLSLDLIFALPPQVERSWERDVNMSLALEPEHLSLYGLTVEPHTPLARWRDRGIVSEAPDERYEREFLYAHETLGGLAAMEHYEVSNFARPGRKSRHNSAYWSGVPFAGLGPSAHSFDCVSRSWNVASYVEWRRRLLTGDDPVAGSELLEAENRVAEEVYLGLRTAAGLPLAGMEFSHVQRWVDAGWGTATNGRLILTADGWLRLDALAADLTVFRSR